MRVRTIACLSAAALLLLLAAAPAEAQSPAQPSNDPTPVAGYENGRLPADRLITVFPGCRTVREAGSSAALLYREAVAINVPLGESGCYRPVDDQVSLYAKNTSSGGPCTAKPTTYPDGRPRGTSNHGWGKAIDFANAGVGMTFGSSGYRF